MSRHWAIMVGINQYQFRQPLIFAQQDAQAFSDWLIQQAQIPSQQCLLSTDSSPLFQGRSTYPTAEALKTWIDWLRKEGIQTGDSLWVFFSGYGECWQGQDYLLPIDAEEAFSPRTWLSVRSLLSSLKTLPTEEILVFLDMNRSQSARSDDRVGRQTMTIAKELGVPLLLSCQPEQFSHESVGLGHGLFTEALLEGLRTHAGQPLGVLVKFLQRRLPELSEHHYRPRQDPLVMIAPKQLEQWIIPGSSALQTLPPQAIQQPIQQPPIQQPIGLAAPTLPSTPNLPKTTPPRPSMAAPEAMELGALELEAVPPAAITLEEVLSDGARGSNGDSNGDLDELAGVSVPRARKRPAYGQPESEDEPNHRQVLLKILILGGLIAIVLPLANLLRGQNPTLPQAQNKIDQAATPAPNSNANTSSSPMPTAPSPDPSPRLNVPESPPADSAKILEDARALIRPTSASELQLAIERASQIPPGDGRYPETKRQIDRWCRDILDLAGQRAERSQFKEAITTAQLIPEKRCPQSAGDATKAIAQWRKRVR